MPAQIIQTNNTPFNKIAIDPVTLDIIENALRNARIEMDATLVRTAMSPGIREQGDAFPLIADHTGKMIVGQFGSFIGGFLDNFDGSTRRRRHDFLVGPVQLRRRDFAFERLAGAVAGVPRGAFGRLYVDVWSPVGHRR